MIHLTKIDSTEIVVNADEIETVEHAHDSTITLKSGRKIIVSENDDEIIRRVVEYKKTCNGVLEPKIVQ
jgi:flagellar protein FlbD